MTCERDIGFTAGFTMNAGGEAKEPSEPSSNEWLRLELESVSVSKVYAYTCSADQL